MSARASEMRRTYAAALASYLAGGGEAALRQAYELGREAVGAELGIVDLAFIHHDALAPAIAGASPRSDVEHVLDAAAGFFAESVSAFEMVQLGFKEAQDAAAFERIQAGMLRQLSGLLADASLAVDASRSLGEVLQLVAEGTRELVAADACVAAAVIAGVGRRAGVACEDGDAATRYEREAAAVAPRLLERAPEGSLRLTEDELTALSVASTNGGGWVGAMLTALDGSLLGSIQVFGSESGAFSALDEAVVTHVARMTSATVERSSRYGS